MVKYIDSDRLAVLLANKSVKSPLLGEVYSSLVTLDDASDYHQKAEELLQIRLPSYTYDGDIIGLINQVVVVRQMRSSDLSDSQPASQLVQLRREAMLPLSKREAECLRHLLHGKTCKGIANILEISAKTVEYYLAQLKQKFNCYSKAELIEKAIRLGYLEYFSTCK